MLDLEKDWYLFRRIIYQIRWVFISILWIFFRPKKGDRITNKVYSIGIVTYVDRYERFFQPLLKRLLVIYPDTEFVIAINGYHDQNIQADYLEKINLLLEPYANVRTIPFNEPQSLSKLWNLLVLNSTSDKTIIFNDDIRIAPFFRRNIAGSGILDEEVALMNSSWSHFLISKNIIKNIGWFDERFPAVGNEDEDYECRLVLSGLKVKSIKIRGLKNIVFKTTNFSWKNTEVVNTKYVRANQIFFNLKWNVTTEPAEGFVYVRILDKYVKLKPGMETPEFYPAQQVVNISGL